MGLHVMFRLYFLDEWLALEEGVSYYPNFSRNVLIEQVLVRSKRPREYMRWAIKELNKKRESVIADLMEDDEVEKAIYKLSPIFISCLVGAQHPLNVIDNAMYLRDSKAAKKIRKVNRELSSSSVKGEDKTMQLRRELRNALVEFDEINTEKRKFDISGSADVSIMGPKIGISIKKTIKDKSLFSNTAFLIEILSSSISMVNTMDAVEHVFGAIELDDDWVLSAI
jgi:hypothetical protein